MDNQEHLIDLAAKIHTCERAGRAISSDWFQLEHMDTSAANQLNRHCNESLTLLHQLTNYLDETLVNDGKNQNLQHAYNIVQELIQSRTASQEMLENILKRSQGYEEYYRALAIKEKAAFEQSEKLEYVLKNLH